MTYTYIADVELERGEHLIGAQVNNIWNVLTIPKQTFTIQYENATNGIDLYCGEERVEAYDVIVTDVPLPDLPSLSFTSDSYLAGNITVRIRSRGMILLQFRIHYRDKQDGVWTYKCDALEMDSLQAPITLQVGGVSSVSLAQSVSSLYVKRGDLLSAMVYGRQYHETPRITILSEIGMLNNLDLAVRNGTLRPSRLYDPAAIARLAVARDDPTVDWSSDTNTYDKVRVYYQETQSPNPNTAITDYDSARWTGTVSDVTATTNQFLPPSRANYMLRSDGNATRDNLAIRLAPFDRIRFNWLPESASSMTLKLQQDGNNYLTCGVTFQGSKGAGFIAAVAQPSDVATYTVTIPANRIASIYGQMAKPCSYRGTLKRDDDSVIWQGKWQTTDGYAFEVSVPESIYKVTMPAKVVLEFRGAWLLQAAYGVQCTELHFNEYAATFIPSGSTVNVLRTYHYSGGATVDTSVPNQLTLTSILGSVPTTTGNEKLRYAANAVVLIARWVGAGSITGTHETMQPSVYIQDGKFVCTMTFHTSNVWSEGNEGQIQNAGHATVTVDCEVYELLESGTTVWGIRPWVWSTAYNLFDSVSVALATMTKVGNPTTIASIICTMTGVNYLDAMCLYATDAPWQYVEVGSGSHVYEVRNAGFVSSDAALAYAHAVYAVVSQERQEYRKTVPLSTDVELGDMVLCDNVNMPVFQVVYQESSKTISMGMRIGNLLATLQAHARRIDALERNL